MTIIRQDAEMMRCQPINNVLMSRNSGQAGRPDGRRGRRTGSSNLPIALPTN